MISTEGIQHLYNAENKIKLPDIRCNSGEGLIILEKSGSGKSTLLHILCGLLKPTQGKVLIQDTDLYKLTEIQRDEFRKKNIGIVLQKTAFIESLTALENLRFFYKIATGTVDDKKCVEWMEKFNIGNKKDQMVNDLSQGELQRLAIIRAMIHKPMLVLADEPSSALDDENAQAVAKVLKEQSEQANAALIIVTHDIRLKSLFHNQILIS